MIVYGKELKNINRGDGTHLIFVFRDHVEEAGDKMGETTLIFMDERDCDLDDQKRDNFHYEVTREKVERLTGMNWDELMQIRKERIEERAKNSKTKENEAKEKETEQNGNTNIQEKGKASKRFMGKIRSRRYANTSRV